MARNEQQHRDLFRDIRRAGDPLPGVSAALAGVDEAGRGPIAGPVVTAAVILDPDDIPDGLDDSKALSARRREALYETIMARAQVGVCAASARRIDATNIRAATLWAMNRAVEALARMPETILVDGARPVARPRSAINRRHRGRCAPRRDFRRLDHRQGHARPA